MGCIPLNRSGADATAFRKMIQTLENGQILALYPEGRRSMHGLVQSGKPGAVLLASHTRVPIIPVGIQGAFDILPKHRYWPRLRRAVVSIGAPITIPPLSKSQRNTKLEALTHQLMMHITVLSQQPSGWIEDRNQPEDNVDHSLHAAHFWNEQGLHPSQVPPDVPASVAYDRAAYICREFLKTSPVHKDIALELARAVGLRTQMRKGVRKLIGMLYTKRLLDHAVALDENYPPTQYALERWYEEFAHMLKTSRYREKILTYYENAARTQCTNLAFLMALARYYVAIEQYSSARPVLDSIMHLTPQSPHDVRRQLEALVLQARITPQFALKEQVTRCFINSPNG